MTEPPISATAVMAQEVDRLVIAVHRRVMALHRSQLQDLTESVGIASPGHFYDLAEFLAASTCTVEIAGQRFRYEPDNTAEALVIGLHDRGLVDDQLRPSEPLVEVIDAVLRWRAGAAANLWGENLVTAKRGAAEALTAASGPLVDAFRSLPDPAVAAHQLHHQLTGLRYARLDAHIAAWEEAGLAAGEIVALSSAVAEERAWPDHDGLVARGWLTTDGTATAEGTAARSSIEAETNSRCAGMFNAVTDGPAWLLALRNLPPHAV